ncbi:YSIRK-type signal peptide-containing protein, partial [Lactobacillus gasseri]
MFKKIIQKFSIRKLSIGAVSVLLGTLFIGTSNSNAEAATVNNDGVEIQNEESNYESTAPVDENEGNDTQVAP